MRFRIEEFRECREEKTITYSMEDLLKRGYNKRDVLDQPYEYNGFGD